MSLFVCMFVFSRGGYRGGENGLNLDCVRLYSSVVGKGRVEVGQVN